ncbi:MAG TPA: twin-arginine translocation signal domain-containing protein, partial [Armatimonadaceae bacterium]|nr:twin-arginine translocation signal domain-containing protein [Armatimonadaceae bacterium]
MLISRRSFLMTGAATAAALAALAAPTRSKESRMEIKQIGSRPSGKGPAEWFTGAVRIDPLFEAPDPARVAGASVTFEPGARTAWPTHPLGLTLVVTAGVWPSGRVCQAVRAPGSNVTLAP